MSKDMTRDKHIDRVMKFVAYHTDWVGYLADLRSLLEALWDDAYARGDKHDDQ